MDWGDTGEGGVYLLEESQSFAQFAAEVVVHINERGNCKCTILTANLDVFQSYQIVDDITIGMVNMANLVEVVLVESLLELKSAVAANYENKDTKIIGLYKAFEVVADETEESQRKCIDSIGNLLYNVAVYRGTTVVLDEPKYHRQLQRWAATYQKRVEKKPTL